MRGVAGLLFACPSTLDRRPASCAVGGAMFGNQFQGRIFVGTSADALPISVDDPLMTNVLDCIFCHCGSTTVRPPARLALRLTDLTVCLTGKRKQPPRTCHPANRTLKGAFPGAVLIGGRHVPKKRPKRGGRRGREARPGEASAIGSRFNRSSECHSACANR
jgi:hypothetical protein